MLYWAHSVGGRATEDWHLLSDHLQDTGEKAAARAAKFAAEDWGRTAGLLHDIGKYAPEFQARLAGDSQRVDHSTAGAQLAVERYGQQGGYLLAFAVAGHHAGLANGVEAGERSTLQERLKREVNDFSAWQAEIVLPERLSSVVLKRHPSPDVAREQAGFQLALFARMLFSCLVDADYLDTEAFYDRIERRERVRGAWPSLSELKAQLAAYLEGKFGNGPAGEVNRLRAEVLAAARARAQEVPGLFSLTVPTGGGKTLSSLAFALDHAVRHKLDRVIYVIPFTSIIEQTAAVFREALGPLQACVLEHHSAFRDDAVLEAARVRGEAERGPAARDKLRLAMETWDAPLVVTTAVQFFESLFANRPSKCRKLHNIARSVIILDEAQILPLPLLRPCVAALDELARNYGSSVVLCTATQPALNERPDDPERSFRGGLHNVREIALDRERLYERLRRVTVFRIEESLDDVALAERVSGYRQVLCIVNTRRHARELYQRIEGQVGAFHLSALMCPAHRSKRLAEIKAALLKGQACRLIATSLVEAGVDVDFPVVYRAEAGVDSIAQAAGRCNREGKRAPADSPVFVFRPEGHAPAPELRQFADAARVVLRQHEDPLTLEAVETYFRELYWLREAGRDRGLDSRGILARLHERRATMMFPFEAIARDFRMIDSDMQPIIILHDDNAKRGLDDLAHPEWVQEHVGAIARRLQPYVVQVPLRVFAALRATGAVQPVNPAQFGEQFCALTNANLYRSDIGLVWDDPTFLAAEALIL